MNFFIYFFNIQETTTEQSPYVYTFITISPYLLHDSKYSFEALGSGLMVFSPFFQFAGQTTKKTQNYFILKTFIL